MTNSVALYSMAVTANLFFLPLLAINPKVSSSSSSPQPVPTSISSSYDAMGYSAVAMMMKTMMMMALMMMIITEERHVGHTQAPE